MAVPGPPVIDEETRQQVIALMSKGAASGLFFATDDCRGKLRGDEGPRGRVPAGATEQPYGIDAGFRDPSGNQMRMVQRAAEPR